MRFNQSSSLRIASSVKATLPGAWFDEPVIFTIRWVGNPDYQKFLEESRADSEFSGVMRDLHIRARAEAEARAGKRRGKERKKFVEEAATEIFSELIRTADLGDGAGALSDEGVVRHLVAHVEGLCNGDTGEPLEWSKEVGLALLALREPIPEDVVVPDEFGDDDFEAEAGTPVGLVIKLWIFWKAGQAELFREAQLEAAEKN